MRGVDLRVWRECVESHEDRGMIEKRWVRSLVSRSKIVGNVDMWELGAKSRDELLRLGERESDEKVIFSRSAAHCCRCAWIVIRCWVDEDDRYDHNAMYLCSLQIRTDVLIDDYKCK